MSVDPRLEGKNVLFIIPKDYYDEEQLEPLLDRFRAEGAEIRVASTKFKEAIGMKKGRQMPDMLVVDAIEGIIGDSYVTGGRGVRQVKGVFHGTVVIGGKGAKKYLWKENLVRLILTDRYRSQMVLGAIGTGIGCLGEADLVRNVEVAAPEDKHLLPQLEAAAAILTEDAVSVHERVVTARDAASIEEFAEALIPLIAKTPLK
ncbi:MAG: DJ-1/PfpI family protein [Nitrospinaceae bacterium]